MARDRTLRAAFLDADVLRATVRADGLELLECQFAHLANTRNRPLRSVGDAGVLLARPSMKAMSRRRPDIRH